MICDKSFLVLFAFVLYRTSREKKPIVFFCKPFFSHVSESILFLPKINKQINEFKEENNHYLTRHRNVRLSSYFDFVKIFHRIK